MRAMRLDRRRGREREGCIVTARGCEGTGLSLAGRGKDGEKKPGWRRRED